MTDGMIDGYGTSIQKLSQQLKKEKLDNQLDDGDNFSGDGFGNNINDSLDELTDNKEEQEDLSSDIDYSSGGPKWVECATIQLSSNKGYIKSIPREVSKKIGDAISKVLGTVRRNKYKFVVNTYKSQRPRNKIIVCVSQSHLNQNWNGSETECREAIKGAIPWKTIQGYSIRVY